MPPNCGDVSSDKLDMALDVARPETTVLLVTFFNPPPEASTAKKTSPLAIVEISDKSVTAIGLKFVPSATSICPDVFVPITKSSPVIVKSPPTVTFPVVVTVSIYASFQRTPVVPKSTSLSVCGPKTPSETNTCSALAA